MGNQSGDGEVVFWTCDDAPEELIHPDLDGAIEEWLDSRDSVKDFPETLDVYGYTRDTVDEKTISRCALGVTEDLLERLDDDYGNPEDATTRTEDMEAAAVVFVRSVLEHYKVWRCKGVATKTVNVMEWVKKNCPHWLEEGTDDSKLDPT